MTRRVLLSLLLLVIPLDALAEDATGDETGALPAAVDATEAEAPPAGEAAAPSGTSRWADFELEGPHPFVGISLGPGAMGDWAYGGPVNVGAGFYFGIRGGMLFGRTELAVELAPVTLAWDFDYDPILAFHISIGGLIPLGSSVYWPLRFGLGLAAVNTYALKELRYVGAFEDEVYMMGRLDLIGIAYQYGHLLFEVSLPSVRYCSEFQYMSLWAWLFNISVSYVI